MASIGPPPTEGMEAKRVLFAGELGFRRKSGLKKRFERSRPKYAREEGIMSYKRVYTGRAEKKKRGIIWERGILRFYLGQRRVYVKIGKGGSDVSKVSPQDSSGQQQASPQSET